MPIVKATLNGDSVGSSAVTSIEIPFSLTGGTIVTDEINRFSPMRMKGMEVIAIQVQVDAGTAPNIEVYPQVSIRRTDLPAIESLRFFDLDAGTVVAVGASILLQFTVPAEYVRVRLTNAVGTTATGFVRIMCGA